MLEKEKSKRKGRQVTISKEAHYAVKNYSAVMQMPIHECVSVAVIEFIERNKDIGIVPPAGDE